MANAGDRCNCEVCGNFIGYYRKASIGTQILPPDNAKKIISFPFEYFVCSSRCKDEWKARRSSKKSQNLSNTSSFSNSDSNAVLSPEQIRAQAEAEEIRERAKAEERRIRDQIEKEELEADKAKAKVLKAEGKKWLALWTSIGGTGRLWAGSGLVSAWVIGVGGGIILLIIAAIIGTVFAGLVIRDTMK